MRKKPDNRMEIRAREIGVTLRALAMLKREGVLMGDDATALANVTARLRVLETKVRA